jgi:hypothetical protein
LPRTPGTLQPVSTRAIVTSQPDIECHVCERRLLRGEHHEVFVADGAPRTVCELCTPRALAAGWPREGEAAVLTQAASHSRRGRGLFGRLRRGLAPGALDSREAAPAEDEYAPGEGAPGEDGEPYDFLGGSHGGATATAAVAAPADGPLERALEAFNLSTYRRRLASLARSLGAPEVSVELDPELRLVTILVAWELCWYRYRIDLDEAEPEVALSGQGTELSEIEPDARSANAVADERGALSLIAERV